jgi:hypothetical protein
MPRTWVAGPRGDGTAASCARTVSGMPPSLSRNLELSTPEYDISSKSSSHVGLIAMLRRNTRLSPGLVRVTKSHAADELGESQIALKAAPQTRSTVPFSAVIRSSKNLGPQKGWLDLRPMLLWNASLAHAIEEPLGVVRPLEDRPIPS